MKTSRVFFFSIAAVVVPALVACDDARPTAAKVRSAVHALIVENKVPPGVNKDWQNPSVPFGLRLSAAAEERARHAVTYDAAYVRIPYPNGDVQADRGVCSDEIVRAYRLLGIDLQRLLHEDMARAFHVYPKRWGLPRPDSNIDHRRVPNLAVFFSRQRAALPVSSNGRDFKPGDVVAFAMSDGRPHIGMVTERWSDDGQRPLIMHNIGWGPQIEDMLFTLTITGHYRYSGKRSPS